jgi:hypothetical protein
MKIQEWHVHLYSASEEDWVTIFRTSKGYYFAIEPERERKVYKGGPFQSAQQARIAVKKFMRENWKQWWDSKTGKAVTA